MTNYEKNKELLDTYAAANLDWGVSKEGRITNCINVCSKDCIFKFKNYSCSLKRWNWLQEEYKKPEVDWSKVEINTPILVRISEDREWIERPFAGYYFGKVHTFGLGSTSKSYLSMMTWDYAKLIEREMDKND